MATVNALVAIDAEYFISALGSSDTLVNLSSSGDDKYTYTANRYVRMIVSPNDKGVTDDPNSGPTFTAYTGDTIRWRERSLSLDSEYSVLFYSFQPFINFNLQDEQAGPILTVPIKSERPTVAVPFPEKGLTLCAPYGDPARPAVWTHVPDFYWESEAANPGASTFAWLCRIYQRRSGADPIAYFAWHAGVTVTTGP